MKVITIVTITPLMIIPMYLIAANVVFNSLYTVNTANTVYKEEQ